MSQSLVLFLTLFLLSGSGAAADADSIAAFSLDQSLTNPVQPALQARSDNSLESVRRADRAGRGIDGKLVQLPALEHARRANIYLANRAFEEARAHWQALIERYPNETNVPAALFGIGRSFFLPHFYAESLPYFERVAREYPQTKDGREGLNSSAAALLRLGRAREAAARYREYTERYPQGERIESAYLNVIDSLREAGQPQEALVWIARTRERFAGTATDKNALFARLRLFVAEGDWTRAVQTADELRNVSLVQKEVLTSFAEVSYLKAYGLERAGRTEEAINSYLMIPDTADSYYGSLATQRLQSLADAARRPQVLARTSRAQTEIAAAAINYPAPFREVVLRSALARRVDPRLVLAIMRQESQFKPRAKSPAAARGLLQLTIDTASKYASRSGYVNLQEDDLYRPEVSATVGAAYLAELSGLFPNLPEAVIASYNGGEDNVARWVKRARQTDPGVFTSEIGFSETKTYVFKVMANYRAYRQLYTQDLVRKNGV
ncbi:MAG TPA: transglycosylase SLT domain-containing protein [Pyrinomonadaceae bacterium]|jgi:soluble lytic murein transglycosylase